MNTVDLTPNSPGFNDHSDPAVGGNGHDVPVHTPPSVGAGMSSARPAPSGTRPAETLPRSGTSGTSGRLFQNNFKNGEDRGQGEGNGTPREKSLPPETLPDVPDLGNSVPDGCRTAAGRAGPAEPASPRPLIVRGVLQVGRMRESRDQFAALENPDLRQLLVAGQPADTIIEAAGGAEIVILDADTHHWPKPPSEEELAAHLGAVSPQAEVTWTSHGHGMKLVYTGPYCRGRALSAAFSLPTSFGIELLAHTRHPRSASSDHADASCGPVIFNETDPDAPFEFKTFAGIKPELRQEALDKLDMKLGGRFDHDHCPLSPEADTDAKGCVRALETGVYCHRCAARGIQFRKGLPPGFMPYSAIVGSDLTVLAHLSYCRVHWTHAHHVLTHHHPNLGPTLLEEAYRKTLQVRYGASDPRIGNIFNRDLDFVRGADVWLDARTFEPTQVDNDAANGMPYCQYTRDDGNGKPEVHIDSVRRAQVKNRTPEGYEPIRPVRGISFATDDQAIPVLAPPFPKHPIKLLDDPMPEDEALVAIESAFPRLDRRYLKACITAAICAEAGGGQPPMLCASGPSGSGKGETIRLAASFMGEDAVKVQLCDDSEAFARNVGMLLAAGHRYIVFDELGKIPSLNKKLGALLQLGSVVAWRPLYQNRRVQTPCRAAFFFPCVRFPDFLCSSAEFVRRTRHLRLHRKTPNWSQTSGGDTAQWRDRTDENARSANSLLTHAWRLCHDHEFRFF